MSSNFSLESFKLQTVYGFSCPLMYMVMKSKWLCPWLRLLILLCVGRRLAQQLLRVCCLYCSLRVGVSTFLTCVSSSVCLCTDRAAGWRRTTCTAAVQAQACLWVVGDFERVSCAPLRALCFYEKLILPQLT